MAVGPKNTSITSGQVAESLNDFDGQKRPTKKLREYLIDKIEGEGQDGEVEVDTSANDSLPDTTALVDMILLDVESYG